MVHRQTDAVISPFTRRWCTQSNPTVKTVSLSLLEARFVYSYHTRYVSCLSLIEWVDIFRNCHRYARRFYSHYDLLAPLTCLALRFVKDSLTREIQWKKFNTCFIHTSDSKTA